jgi:heme-degrading monooxygenase HmoA
MVYVLAQLKLESFQKWKAIFDQRVSVRKEAGSKEARLFRNINDDTEVVILFDWDTLENARKYMESDVLREALEKVGATYTTTYLDEVEITT